MKPTSTYYDRVRGAAESISERLDAAHASVAVILGSGLAGAASILEQARSVPYVSIPGFPEPTVAGHPGRLACGMVAGRKTLFFCGRVHGYEGYAPSEVGFGIRLAATLGVGTVIVTNVSGGVDPALKVGEIVAITDHLNLTGQSPLTGTNDERFGPRFVDMTDTYAPELRQLAIEAARATGLGPLRESVYAGMAGPQYETPAEVRMLRMLGAGLVGMSTVLEVIAARHAGMKILGLSLVANPAAGVEPAPLRHEDVTDAAAAGTKKMASLLAAIIAKIEP
ncbi:MAG: purine-nucleoside phosphorylase [Deltaproteobacteria bacterium]|nr:purine-nucleoside phosphorylase [Deltaproteobacteria bacterium]